MGGGEDNRGRVCACTRCVMRVPCHANCKATTCGVDLVLTVKIICISWHRANGVLCTVRIVPSIPLHYIECDTHPPTYTHRHTRTSCCECTMLSLEPRVFRIMQQ